MKNETVTTKGNKANGLDTNYVEETLKFVESDEMKKHLRKWFASGSVRRPIDICAEIVYNAPVPLEQKLPILKLLSKHEEKKDSESEMYFQVTKAQIDDRYNKTEGMVYDLTLYNTYDSYNEEGIKFDSFDEAIEHIKSLDKQAKCINKDEAEIQKCLMKSNLLTLDEAVLRQKIKGYENEYGLVYELDMVPSNELGNLRARWYLNEIGEILYATCFLRDVIPGRLNIPTPFVAGDIVIADCQPFGCEQKVLILENEDTFDWVDGCSVTCVFINKYGNIDVGYFKSNEFLQRPYSTYISALYRAKTFTGELSKRDAPLGVIKDALAKRPKLGREMFTCLNNLKMYTLGMHPSIKSNGRYKDESYGIGWDAFKKGFGL